jgi:hypothetical protein
LSGPADVATLSTPGHSISAISASRKRSRGPEPTNEDGPADVATLSIPGHKFSAISASRKRSRGPEPTDEDGPADVATLSTPGHEISAISRSRKRSRGSEPEDEEEIVTKKRHVEPRAGRRPIVNMTLLGPTKEVTVRVLLDPGATVPVLSDKVVHHLKIPPVRRKDPRLLSSWNSEVSKDAGVLYTPELILRHQRDHFSYIAFEISIGILGSRYGQD